MNELINYNAMQCDVCCHCYMCVFVCGSVFSRIKIIRGVEEGCCVVVDSCGYR